MAQTGFNRRLSAWLPALAVLVGCSSTPGSLPPLTGRPNDPLFGTPLRARVLIFVSNDCPIANRYAPEIRRLHERYAPQGVAFWLVHSDPQETPASVEQHDREYGLTVPVWLDPQQSLARIARAQVVPSAAVFGATGQLLYRGRIDDRFAEIGRERPQATRHDLAAALEDVLARRPVRDPITKAVGCYIPGAN